ncbi:MAG: DMT family transporter [Cyanobacteria bacterium P01_G01_bin.67]
MKKVSLLTPESEIDQTVNIETLPNKFYTSVFSLGILALAIIALAFSPIFTKLSELEISPIATIFNRLWIATIIMWSWRLVKKPQPQNLIEQTSKNTASFNLSKRNVVDREKDSNLEESIRDYQQQGLLILASLSATASAILWAVSFTQTSVASSTVLRSLTPLFISLGAWLILNQTFDRQFILGMLLATMGGMGIGWDDWQLGSEHLIGDAIALLSAALHGANILIVGYLRDHGLTSEQVLLWRCACGAVITLPFAYLTDTPLLPISPWGWLTVIALAVVCQTFGQGLLVFSLKQYSSSFVGIFALLKPMVTALLAWLIFAEGISIYSGIAVILILVGIFLAKTSDSNLKSAVGK